MPISWTDDGRGLHATVQSGESSGVYHLIVEPLPSGGLWDWAVWNSGMEWDPTHTGQTTSRPAAIAAAEACVADCISRSR